MLLVGCHFIWPQQLRCHTKPQEMQKWRLACQADVLHLKAQPWELQVLSLPPTLNLTGQDGKRERWVLSGRSEMCISWPGGLPCKLPATLPQRLHVYSQGLLTKTGRTWYKLRSSPYNSTVRHGRFRTLTAKDKNRGPWGKHCHCTYQKWRS